MNWFISVVIKQLIQFFADAFLRWQKDIEIKKHDEAETHQNTQELQDAQTKEDQQKANSDMAKHLGG